MWAVVMAAVAGGAIGIALGVLVRRRHHVTLHLELDDDDRSPGNDLR